jgi:YbbR domain-containing protein
VDRLLKNNTVVKVIAFLLAVMLWMVANTSTDTGNGPASPNFSQRIEGVTPEVLYDASKYTLVEEIPKTVDITLHGGRLDLLMELLSQIKVVADATHLSAGVHQVPVQVENLPAGVTWDPLAITIRLEPILTKQFDVKVVPEGSPGPGYFLGQATVNPPRVLVTGADTDVSKVAGVEARIQVSQASSPVQEDVPLVAVDKYGNRVPVTIIPKTAVVSLPVNQAFKTVPLLLQVTGSVAAGMAIDQVIPSTTQVSVGGPNKALENLRSVSVPPVDVTGLASNKTFHVLLPHPAGITSIEPAAVDVVVTVVPAVQRTFANIPVKLVGVPSGWSAVFDGPSQVSVVVQGAKGRIAALTSSDVEAYVDLSGAASPGTHSVAVQVNVPSYLTAGPISPATVAVKMSPAS